MKHFWQGFEKTSAARWQKAWGGLSDVAKRRLRNYAGAGVKDLPAMREGMFSPQHSAATLAHRGKTDKLVYDNARRNRPDVLKLNSSAMPYAVRESSKKTVTALPKNPASGHQTRSKARPDLRGAEGTHNRSMLEHEGSEAFMEKAKGKRSEHGRWARSQKAIQESGDVVHSSAHPLIAEANVSGRHPKALRDMRSGWSETPAQGKMYSVLKQTGWTPERGLPLYGRQAKAVQSKAEKIFAPRFQELHKKQIVSTVKRFRGRKRKVELDALRREAKEYAGGGK